LDGEGLSAIDHLSEIERRLDVPLIKQRGGGRWRKRWRWWIRGERRRRMARRRREGFLSQGIELVEPRDIGARA